MSMTETRRRPEGLTGRRAVDIACVVGVVLSLGLLFIEVGDEPALEVGDVVEERSGLVSSVVFEVQSNSDDTLCPEVRVAARDREARNLVEVVAQPQGERFIAPGATAAYSASLEIDAVDYKEKLQEIRAYIYESRPCEAGG